MPPSKHSAFPCCIPKGLGSHQHRATAGNSQLRLGSLCPLMRGSTLFLTVRLPASVVPATSPVPHAAAQRPQIQQGSGTSAGDPPWNSNKELCPAAASARVRTQAGWSFISLTPTPTQHTHASPQALIQQLPGVSLYQYTHPCSDSSMFTHSASPTHPSPTNIYCFTK